MIEPPVSCDETFQLKTLHSMRILDAEPEERFDRITRLAKRVFGVPIALVSLVDANGHWCKSRQGLDTEDTPQEYFFCAHAIAGDNLLVVENAALDERFRHNPLVTGGPRIRFYAGYPIHGPNGCRLGALCIIDTVPREFSEEDRNLLCELGKMLDDEMFTLTNALTDDLTGLSNRRGFRTIASHVLAICKRSASPATLVMLDLDGFKEINDTCGHAEGDNLLKDFAATLLKTFRDSDVVARLGGDEFCVLMTGSNDVSVTRALQRLEAGLAARHKPGKPEIRFSAGAAHYNPLLHVDVDAFLCAADEGMYDTKRTHKLNSTASRATG